MAVMIEYAEHLVVLISVYILYGDNANKNEGLLKTRLKLVKATHHYVEHLRRKKAKLLVCGDFNRYDQLWGRNKVSKMPQQGEGAKIIDFMMENNLHLLLSQGTPVYKSFNGVNSSTINLSLASKNLTNLLTECKILLTEYGFDHRAINMRCEILINTNHVNSTSIEI